ncbi:MAG: M48 family metallopeptidase [Magnetospirillum sp.]|nr:M48 family metallopeptidase [Magnetospirillum sp.]
MTELRADRPGRFSDGRSAGVRKVVVRVLATGMEIRGIDGFLIAVWKTEDLRADGDWPEMKGVRLRCASEPDARLAVEDAYFIKDALPKVDEPRRRRIGLILGALLGAGVLAGLVLSLPMASRLAASLVPAGMERDWGRNIAAGFESQLRVCEGKAGRQALEGLIARLAEGLPADRRSITLHVIDRPDVNALALPGGDVILFAGLIAKADSPDEIAGVLGHELTHIGRRHVSAAMIRGMGVGVIATLITGDASGLVASGIGAALAGAYSRDDEAEADRGGMDLLERAGIGSDGMITFFRRLEDMEGKPGMLTQWLGTHPEAGARAAAIAALRRPAPHLPSMDESQWRSVKAICSKSPP